MVRGVNISDPLRKHRLVSYMKHKEITDFTRTMLLVSSMRGTEATPRLVKEYSNLLFNSDKYDEKTIEENKEILEEEMKKVYEITDVFE